RRHRAGSRMRARGTFWGLVRSPGPRSFTPAATDSVPRSNEDVKPELVYVARRLCNRDAVGLAVRLVAALVGSRPKTQAPWWSIADPDLGDRFMRCRTVVLGGAVILTLAACRKDGRRELGSDPKARESYSLGYKLGSTLKSQDVVLDLEWYIRGLREGVAGAASQVKPEELRSAVVELRQKAMDAQKAGLTEDGDKHRAAGEAFLDQNKRRDGVRVLPSGLQLKVLKEGTGKTKPTATDIVVVKYRGTLVDGTEFASTEKKKKNGVIALDRAIPAWREALP